MDKKGQMGLGLIIIIAVTLIVGAVFLQSAAQQVGNSVNTISVANESIATVVNGTAQYLTNYRYIEDVVIYNETGDIIISSGNYTITNNVVYNGGLAVEILPDASDGFKSAWQVSGTAQPLTYIPDSGTRAIAGLIVILFALAIAVVALTPTLRSGVMQMMGR